MKKVNFKKVLMALVAVFALMFFSVEKAEAQAQVISPNTTGTGLYDPAPGTFLGSDEARDLLMNTIVVLKNNAGTPGSASYQEARRTGLYYNGILNELVTGKSVPEAIVVGLLSLNDTNGFGDLQKNDLAELRNGAVDLLQ